jgi:hypothetical protein
LPAIVNVRRVQEVDVCGTSLKSVEYDPMRSIGSPRGVCRFRGVCAPANFPTAWTASRGCHAEEGDSAPRAESPGYREDIWAATICFFGPWYGRRPLERVESKRTENGRPSRERFMAALLSCLTHDSLTWFCPAGEPPHDTKKGMYT